MAAAEKKITPTRAELVRKQINRDVLDFGHLGRYTFGDISLETELLGLFKVQALQQFELLLSASTQADWKIAIHSLKGAAAGIGANRVADVAKQIESEGFEVDPGQSHHQFSTLKSEIDVCLESIALFASGALQD